MAYEIIWDFLDNLSERAAAHGQTDGYRLHLAIAEAVDPDAQISPYYIHHPWQNDAGYLRKLVQCCQRECRALPSYPHVRALVIREAHRAQVLAINHLPDAAIRDFRLEHWVAEEYPDQPRGRWWELSGAASAPLAIHALLALAAEPRTHSEPADVYAAYATLSATTTMLDSYVDQHQDLETDDHSYISHYPDPQSAVHGIILLVERSLDGVSQLHNGDRHSMIAAAMVAMYLSKSIAQTQQGRRDTHAILGAAGSLTRLLTPILRAWRILNAQQSS